MNSNRPRAAPAEHVTGFTLLELLAVIAIIALLVSVLLPVIGKARQHARMVVELSAVRNLMFAHTFYSQDHQGRFIPGYDTKARASGPQGQTLSFPQNARYPWRLVPYVDKTLKQTVLVHQRLEEVQQDNGQYDTYAVSVMPSFGINGEFVGGTWGGPYNNWLVNVGVTVTRTAQAFRPADLIVFASARGGLSGTDPVLGYHMIQPAYGAEYHEEDLPSVFGYVHPRYDQSAVVSFLDAHAATLDIDQLQDMTRWSNAAARSGDPDWTLSDAIP